MPRIIETDLSIFQVKAEILVNPVNCVGVMGAGLARDFAFQYPEMLNSYKEACKRKTLKTGSIHFFPARGKCIINLPTKMHWRDKSDYSFIQSGMNSLVQFLLKPEQDYRTVAIPRLGCGLGELDWDTVRKIIVNACDKLSDDFTIYLFEAKNN